MTMNYNRVYNEIINNALSENRERYKGEYYELHHIKPLCMNGSNEKENTVLLTAREHFLCHWLLVKIYNYNYRLVSAFNSMCRVSDDQKRNNAKHYEIARKYFSKYHPSKNDEVKDKIRTSINKFFQDTLNERRKTVECACGCGETMVVHLSSTKKYINQKHASNHRKGQPLPTETKEMLSEIAKERLSKLSDAEQKERVKNSMGTCDHKKRGEAISKGKKGKKTNQIEIMGKKFAKMTDEEFSSHIKNMSKMVKSRFTNARNKYL